MAKRAAATALRTAAACFHPSPVVGRAVSRTGLLPTGGRGPAPAPARLYVRHCNKRHDLPVVETTEASKGVTASDALKTVLKETSAAATAAANESKMALKAAANESKMALEAASNQSEAALEAAAKATQKAAVVETATAAAHEGKAALEAATMASKAALEAATKESKAAFEAAAKATQKAAVVETATAAAHEGKAALEAATMASKAALEAATMASKAALEAAAKGSKPALEAAEKGSTAALEAAARAAAARAAKARAASTKQARRLPVRRVITKSSALTLRREFAKHQQFLLGRNYSLQKNILKGFELHVKDLLVAQTRRSTSKTLKTGLIYFGLASLAGWGFFYFGTNFAVDKITVAVQATAHEIAGSDAIKEKANAIAEGAISAAKAELGLRSWLRKLFFEASPTTDDASEEEKQGWLKFFGIKK